MPLHYYLYISMTKVSMLTDQMVSRRSLKRSTEAGFSLRFLSAKRTEETGEDTSAAALDRVLEQLAVDGEIGTVDAPATYFHGEAVMRWNVIGEAATGAAAVFAGEHEGTTVVLGGSDHHLLGSGGTAGSPSGGPSRSLPPVLLGRLGAMSDLEDERILGLLGDNAGGATEAETALRAAKALTGPQQRLEFTAKTIYDGHGTVDGQSRRVLLGSPLYVALRS